MDPTWPTKEKIWTRPDPWMDPTHVQLCYTPTSFTATRYCLESWTHGPLISIFFEWTPYSGTRGQLFKKTPLGACWMNLVYLALIFWFLTVVLAPINVRLLRMVLLCIYAYFCVLFIGCVSVHVYLFVCCIFFMFLLAYASYAWNKCIHSFIHPSVNPSIHAFISAFSVSVSQMSGTVHQQMLILKTLAVLHDLSNSRICVIFKTF